MPPKPELLAVLFAILDNNERFPVWSNQLVELAEGIGALEPVGVDEVRDALDHLTRIGLAGRERSIPPSGTRNHVCWYLHENAYKHPAHKAYEALCAALDGTPREPEVDEAHLERKILGTTLDRMERQLGEDE